MAYKIDGIRMELNPHDVDNDGITGGVESVSSHKDKGVMNIQEKGELAEALELQNRDVMTDDNLSSVDFASRLNNFQVAPIVAVDVVASMNVISERSRMIVRHIMRKLVSLDGKGRSEFVDVVVGKQERDTARKSLGNLTPEGQQK